MMSKTLAVTFALFGLTSGQQFEAKQKYTEGTYATHKRHASTLTCPKGYYLEGSRCIVKTEVAEELACPSGSVEVAGQCLNYSAGRYTCPNELRLVGKACIGKDTTRKVRKCPAGSFARGDECIVIGDYPSLCGNDLTAEGGRCANIMAKLKQCPAGYTSIGDLCIRRDTRDAERTCPSGTIDNGSTCSFTTTFEPVCPAGTEDLGDRCVTYAEEVQRCPDGYRRAGSWCERIESAEKTIECANGQDPAKNCAQKVPVELEAVCNIGKLWNGQCSTTSHINADYQCPAGYTASGSSCTKTVSYDCSTTEHDVVCDETPTGKGVHLRQLAPADLKQKYNSAEYATRHNLPVCHKVPRIVSKTCERSITAQGEAFCSQGTLKAGNRCEIVNYTAPDYVCNATSGTNGECYVTETSTPLRSCPAGYVNSGSKCTTVITATPEWSCPRNTDGPNCATYTNKSCSGPGGSCETTVIERAVFVCPEGYAKIAATGKCLKLEYADKVLTCPADAEERDGLTCAQYFAPKIEDFIEKIKAQFVCPAGYAEVGAECVKRSIQPANFVCPRDANIDGTACGTPVAKLARCPKGSTALKNKCWVIQSTEAVTVDTVVSGGKKM